MKEESVRIVEAALDFYEALIREDYSYSGNSKTSAEEDVNLHAARFEFLKAIRESDTLDQALSIIKTKIEKLKGSIAHNEKHPITRADLLRAGITPLGE